MGTNRKLRSSGNIEIVSNATTVSGTLGVTGQSTLSGIAYPTSDGNADQVLVTNGSGTLSFADASGGLNVITLSNQTEATAYSPQENDFVKITGSCELSGKTITNVNFAISLSATLTISGGSTITNCNFNGRGSIEVKATSTYSNTSAKESSAAETTTVDGCSIIVDTFDCQIRLGASTGHAAIRLRDCFISCDQYRHYLRFSGNLVGGSGGGGDASSGSFFDNLTIMAKRILARPSDDHVSNIFYVDGVAHFSNIVASANIPISTSRVMIESTDELSDPSELEDGSKTNCRQITTSNL